MMRTIFVTGLALAMTTFTTASQASAGVVVDKEATIGKQVPIIFSGSKNIQCSKTVAGTASVSAFISGAESISRSTGLPVTRSNGIFLEITYSNSCTGVSISGTGGISDGMIGPGPLLLLATLNGSTTIQDFESPPHTAPVSLHLTVVGSGPLTSNASTTTSHTSGPLTITISRTAFSSRDAAVSGTLTVNGTTFDLGGTTAQMIANSNATITISKP
jgi:hypothetical protein